MYNYINWLPVSTGTQGVEEFEVQNSKQYNVVKHINCNAEVLFNI